MEMPLNMSENRKLVIPSSLRKFLWLSKGGKITVRTKGKNRLEMESSMGKLTALQKELFAMKPKNRNMTDELIAERRQEFLREEFSAVNLYFYIANIIKKKLL